MNEVQILIAVAVLVVVGAVAGYLFLRANPRKKAALDKFVDENKPK